MKEPSGQCIELSDGLENHTLLKGRIGLKKTAPLRTPYLKALHGGEFSGSGIQSGSKIIPVVPEISIKY